MAKVISTLLLGIAASIALLVLVVVIVVLAGQEWAVWALGALLMAGLPLLIFWLLCFAIGLELRNFKRRGKAGAQRRLGAMIFGVLLIAVGVVAAIYAYRLGLRILPVHTSRIMVVCSIAVVWIGSYILRRRPAILHLQD